MTQTYAQVTRQIAALQTKAEQLRKREVEGVVERIRVAIKAYGLSAEHLFGSGATPKRIAKKGGKRVAKQRYADGQGNVWGGMGPRPQWLRNALAEGRALEEFVKAGPSASPAEGASPVSPSSAGKKKAKRSGKRGKKRTARQGYANGTDSWSGFGRQPRWLRAALDGGATLEEMKVAATRD